MKAARILRSRALKAAAKRLPLVSERMLKERIEGSGLTAAEAYVCGAEEAQVEIIQRLHAVPVVPK